MSEPIRLTGLILAGGRSLRMGRSDKGLVDFNGRPLISYGLDAMRAVTPRVVISANRSGDRYALFGCPVIADRAWEFGGPLAGILAGMDYAERGGLVVMPCDMPFIEGRHLAALAAALTGGVRAAAAFDGRRLHPVVAALDIDLKPSLQAYLADGRRKAQAWLAEQAPVGVDFSSEPEIFANLNTPDDVQDASR